MNCYYETYCNGELEKLMAEIHQLKELLFEVMTSDNKEQVSENLKRWWGEFQKKEHIRRRLELMKLKKEALSKLSEEEKQALKELGV